MEYKSVKGTRDILPPESDAWIFLESMIRDVMSVFQYREIRTPVFEETSVFSREKHFRAISSNRSRHLLRRELTVFGFSFNVALNSS